MALKLRNIVGSTQNHLSRSIYNLFLLVAFQILISHVVFIMFTMNFAIILTYAGNFFMIFNSLLCTAADKASGVFP